MPACARTILSTTLAVALASFAQASSIHEWGHTARHNYTFETVTGFFQQDFLTTNASTFDVLSTNFGLVSTAPLHWQAFEWSIDRLNKDAPKDVSYRVFYLARHGEGYHNVAESFYGTPAWDDYWSKINTDGNITWGPDALLTRLGTTQALAIRAAWTTQAAAGAPVPASFYASPLTRAADTLALTWAGRVPPPAVPVGANASFASESAHGKYAVPVFVEGLRETIGVHTCDERHPRSWIAAREPGWAFARGFAEADTLWHADVRETDAERLARVGAALAWIVDNDDATYLSVTAHGGAITSALQAFGHRAFSLQTGGMIPVVVKVTKV